MATTPPTRPGAVLRSAASSLLRWLASRSAGSSVSTPGTVPTPGRAATTGRPPRTDTGGSPAYPGDYTGALTPVYAPSPDGRPDPGEIVWTWVPFEEDHGQGKDRPVLLVGHDGRWLLGLQLTSKDHDRHPERDDGRTWVDIGTGAWDRQGRPSEVRVDRVVRVDPNAVRREGAVLSPARFGDVAQAVADLHR